MFELMNLDSIQISLASPEKIREWSHGEVTKAETINYRTLKPERDGLFCERIFGPTKDWECNCGKYKRLRFKGVICDKCGVEVTKAKVRRERMGHIELAAPVSHIWYFKGIPSRMGTLLEVSPRTLEQVLYFANYIVLDPGDPAVTGLQLHQLLNETEYQEKRRQGEELGFDFRVGIGAEAVREMLLELDLDELNTELRAQLAEISAKGSKRDSENQKRQHIIKRLEVVEAFRQSGNKPEWMILDVIPVIPPELRPMVQLDGGRFATADLNDLYRRVINRNNRLKRMLEMGAPDIIVRNEKRMLQEAVDALIDNGRRGRPVTGAGGRQLKSLSDLLRGKQGRFRQNLLGKRVDYSGRSVIVVGPSLKLYQCGLPKEMALELFKPFVIERLVNQGLAVNVKTAKRSVERMKPEVWDALESVIHDHPVLLNRAPTLHRLGIQAFEPILVEGKALKLHPLCCTAFNADFDGDQMAVHVPLSMEAQAEARFLMLAANNILKPQDGKPVICPTQDMVLGCYYLTLIDDRNVPRDEEEKAEGEIAPERVRGEGFEARLTDDGTLNVHLDGAPSDVTVDTSVRDWKIIGQSIFYLRDNEDRRELKRCDIDAKQSGEAVTVDSSVREWKIIGQSIFYLRDNEGIPELNCYDVDANIDVGIDRFVREWTIIGHSICYTCVDEGSPALKCYDVEAKSNSWTQALPDNTERQLTACGDTLYVRSGGNLYHRVNLADGKLDFLGRRDNSSVRDRRIIGHNIFYLSGNEGNPELHCYDMDANIDVRVDTSLRDWTIIGQSIFYLRGNEGSPELKRYDMDAKSQTGILRLPANTEPRLTVRDNSLFVHSSDNESYRVDVERGKLVDPVEYKLKHYVDVNEALMAYDTGVLKLEEPCMIRMTREFNGVSETRNVRTTIGRIIFNEAIPQDLGLQKRECLDDMFKLEIDEVVGKKQLAKIVDCCFRTKGVTVTSRMLDDIKALGYKYSTRAALTVSVADIVVPPAKKEILAAAESQVHRIEREFKRGRMSENERYSAVIRIWEDATNDVTQEVLDNLEKFNPINMMADSGARGSTNQIRQLAGMRGLMASPTGKIIELPIKANFREGLSVLEFFLSSHGSRKSLADTAMKTADSGYMTRRLVDVSQENIIREVDCFAGRGERVRGIPVREIGEPGDIIETLEDRIRGRVAAADVTDPETGEILVATNELITYDIAKRIIAAGITEVNIRSVLTCQCSVGVCARCYGANMTSGELVDVGEAVGIIAAQSIGEPGTQLTMRTFHTGGVASGEDITQGLPRVEELFEARKPKREATLADIGGTVHLTRDAKKRQKLIIQSDPVASGEGGIIETKEYPVNYGSKLRVGDGDHVDAGDVLIEGSINPNDLLRIVGVKAVQEYLVKEVQAVYRRQGVEIADKHIEVIVRQMLRKVQIEDANDTDLLPGTMVDIYKFEEVNRRAVEEGKRPATAKRKLLGITKAALATDSFLSAASFQETTRVLTEAAIKGKSDPLLGLKENVIIGKQIPAGTGLRRYTDIQIHEAY